MSDSLPKLKRAFADVGQAADLLIDADWDTWESAIAAFVHAVTEHDVRALLGDEIPAGASRYYHTYYRDSNPTFCPSPQGNTFNSTNGVEIRW